MRGIILGAGPAGLAAAHELSRYAVEVVVLEKNSKVGGLCRTVDRDGYLFDMGGMNINPIIVKDLSGFIDKIH